MNFCKALIPKERSLTSLSTGIPWLWPQWDKFFFFWSHEMMIVQYRSLLVSLCNIGVGWRLWMPKVWKQSFWGRREENGQQFGLIRGSWGGLRGFEVCFVSFVFFTVLKTRADWLRMSLRCVVEEKQFHEEERSELRKIKFMFVKNT